jgi:hypothetical protein
MACLHLQRSLRDHAKGTVAFERRNDLERGGKGVTLVAAMTMPETLQLFGA